MRSALLVPVKRFAAAKKRLAAVLTVDERIELARWLATSTIRAAGGLDAYVACDDDDVRVWAHDVGATVLWTPGLGLNGAVDRSRIELAALGIDHVVVAHSDLPLARDLGELVTEDTITIVPDLRLDGTNVLSLPSAVTLQASYGASSFSRHRRRAEATGRTIEIRADDDLSFDLDTPADLARPEFAGVLPAWVGEAQARSRHV